jgi:hypothetical protein
VTLSFPIIANPSGYAPSESVVRYVQKLARRKGFAWEWIAVQTMEDGALRLLMPTTQPSQPSHLPSAFIAVRIGATRQWKFITEKEYLEKD